jgi:hypothetical protein
MYPNGRGAETPRPSLSPPPPGVSREPLPVALSDRSAPAHGRVCGAAGSLFLRDSLTWGVHQTGSTLAACAARRDDPFAKGYARRPSSNRRE